MKLLRVTIDNCAKHISTLNYEFYDPRYRQLHHNNPIPIINHFGLIYDYRNMQKWLFWRVVGHRNGPSTNYNPAKQKIVVT